MLSAYFTDLEYFKGVERGPEVRIGLRKKTIGEVLRNQTIKALIT